VRAEGLEELTIQEHREIILQIKNQDSAAAAKIMKTHLRRSNAEYHRNIK
jgi:DNA-binding GntR family transcriptional regulator